MLSSSLSESSQALAVRWWRALASDRLWTTVVSHLQSQLRTETGADFVVVWIEIPPHGEWLRISDHVGVKVLPAASGPGVLVASGVPRTLLSADMAGPYGQLLRQLGVQVVHLVPLEPPPALRQEEPWRAVLGFGWRQPTATIPSLSPALGPTLWYLMRQRMERAYTDMIVELASVLGPPEDPQDWEERLAQLQPLMGVDHWCLYRLRLDAQNRWSVQVDAETGKLFGYGERVAQLFRRDPQWSSSSRLVQVAERRENVFVADFQETFAHVPDAELVREVRSAYSVYLGQHPERGVGVLSMYWQVPEGWRRVGLSLQPWEALRRLAAEWWVTMHRVRDATVDPLTGVWNRRGFLEAWQRAAGGWQAGTVAFVDVDHFADVNNRWGHLTGDRILRALAQLFQQVAQEGKGWVARWGGDEFLLAWPRALDTREWQATEQTIRARLAHVQAEEDWPCRVTVSGGAVNWQGTPPPLETLLERADQLLYQAKRAGRHRFVGALAEESSFSPEGPHPSGRAPELTQ